MATASPPDAPRRDRTAAVQLVGAMLALMWVAEVADAILAHNLDQYGIEPRQADGLAGVLAAPFLHVGFGHLLSNTVPFLLMGLAIAVGGLARVLAVTVVVGLVSGLGTWLVAPAATVHLGASGLVFGYATYLLIRGLFNRQAVHLLVGVLVAVLWGGALLGGLLPQQGVSWQAHLFGAVGGVLAARLLDARREQR